VWHPTKYAGLLAERMRRHHARAWLVNTGWSGGPFGVGARMKLAYTRAIIDAIHDGVLADAPVCEDPVFGLQVPTVCPGVPAEVLIPRNSWADRAGYDRTAVKLAKLFQANFANFAGAETREIAKAGPRV
jgi:phosphoenolpyruvate carboxykinase (ATP)